MKYVSTRGISRAGVSSAYAIKTGLAEDGGLYMPEAIPSLDLKKIEELLSDSYEERAAKILSLFLTDYSFEELLDDCKSAYSPERFRGGATYVNPLDENINILELWHGPTCAFKDMALQLMPKLFVRALRKCGENRTALILVATSGDTGKAALEGYKNVDGTMIEVFYPTAGVSTVQKMQMQTQEGDNVCVKGIVGNFDDAQSGVKRIFSDSDFANKLDACGIFLSSANSINWGRLVPQIVYYVSAYCDMVNSKQIQLGDKIDVCVPTGNFGNIFACYIAKLMGLPVEKLICASNKNNVLTDFLSTGVYDRNRQFFPTVSPSMDILISSNLERLLYLTVGADATAAYMKELNTTGRYELKEHELDLIKESFIGYYTDEENTLATIKGVYENKNCLIDTHTAVAVSAAFRYINDSKAERKVLVASTASPYKFAKDVLRAITDRDVDDVAALTELCRITGTEIPTPLASLSEKEIIHGATIDKEDMEAEVYDFAIG